MLTLPVTAGTFKKSFLDGDGTVELTSDQDAWRMLFDSNSPFDKNTDRVVNMKIGVNGTTPLTVGGVGTLKIAVSGSVEAVHQIQLIWPDSQIDPAITRGLRPDAKQLLVRLLLQGKADASAQGSAPVGPLKTTFGVTAGGNVSYERLKIYSDTAPAKEILLDLFAGIRLPQQVNTPTEIPQAGEVLVTHFGGYLTISGQVSYGYSITGSKEVDLGKLNLDLDYKLKLAAGLTAGYRFAGEFELETSAGTHANFVRYVVRKSRDAEFNFAADFGIDAEVHLKGLPDTSDEFLAKVFGASAESVLKLFDKTQKYSNIEELEQAVGKLTMGAVHDLSQKLIQKALDNNTLSEFLNQMFRVKEAYESIDARIIHLYEDSLERIPQVTHTLDLLTKITSRDGLKEISDNETWALINRLAGPEIYDILLEDSAFALFARRINEAKSFVDEGIKNDIRDVVRSVKTAFPLNKLLDQLKAITTPDQLRNLADEKLQGLTEKLLGKTFDEIRKSDVATTLQELHDIVGQVSNFKEKYYKKAIEAANRSYSAQMHFSYARANSRTALLDVEVDVSKPDGQELARLAAGGDFANVLAKYNSALVQINKGVLTHTVTSSTQLQINLFGFGVEGMKRVFQNTDEALEAHEGGLLHIYTTTTQVEERRKHGGELTSSSFLLATVAKALQPEGSREYLIRTLPKMSTQYDFLSEDNKTKPEEVRKILDLAERLDIVDAAKFVDQLRTEFPKGLGMVSAKYVVRYDSDAVASAFQIKDGPKRENLQKLAIETIRTFISAKYTAMPQTHSQALLGFGYESPDIFNSFRKLGFAAFVNTPLSVTLPGWFTRGSQRTVQLETQQKQALTTLYSSESKFVDRLTNLDATIDALRDGTGAVSADDLNKQIKEFVEMADDLNFGRENSFFVVFDRLVLEGSGGKSPRASALILEITPPGGEKVTKVMTGARPAAAPDLVATAPAGLGVSAGAGG